MTYFELFESVNSFLLVCQGLMLELIDSKTLFYLLVRILNHYCCKQLFRNKKAVGEDICMNSGKSSTFTILIWEKCRILFKRGDIKYLLCTGKL